MRRACQQAKRATARERPDLSHYALAKAMGVDIKTVQQYRSEA
jgi:hypothetical protein